MEAKKRIKNINLLIVAIYLISFIGLVTLQIWITYTGSGLNLFTLLYWMILVGWLWTILYFHLHSNSSFVLGLVFFILGSALSVIGIGSVAEVFMKVSFIGFFCGGVSCIY